MKERSSKCVTPPPKKSKKFSTKWREAAEEDVKAAEVDAATMSVEKDTMETAAMETAADIAINTTAT